MEPAVLVDGLRKRYGPVLAVDGVDLRVAEGEIFGILGPNGSGKTTTVECVHGLRKADEGRIRVFGVDPQREPERAARMVGIQLQESALPDRIRTAEALYLFATLGLGRTGVRRRAAIRAVVSDALAQWGLTGKRDATFASLSGGQRQRLLVSLALVNRPRLVFLDEMTTGLDPAARHDAWQVIDQVRRQGTTVVLVTHYMDEAERLCDRLCVIAGGRVLVEDTPAGLVARYGGGTRVRFAAPPATAPDVWERLPGVLDARRVDGFVELRGTGPFLTALGAALTGAGSPGTELVVDPPRLEDVYLHMLGTAAP